MMFANTVQDLFTSPPSQSEIAFVEAHLFFVALVILCVSGYDGTVLDGTAHFLCDISLLRMVEMVGA